MYYKTHKTKKCGFWSFQYCNKSRQIHLSSIEGGYARRSAGVWGIHDSMAPSSNTICSSYFFESTSRCCKFLVERLYDVEHLCWCLLWRLSFSSPLSFGLHSSWI